jgi:hypothetical protein
MYAVTLKPWMYAVTLKPWMYTVTLKPWMYTITAKPWMYTVAPRPWMSPDTNHGPWMYAPPDSLTAHAGCRADGAPA